MCCHRLFVRKDALLPGQERRRRLLSHVGPHHACPEPRIATNDGSSCRSETGAARHKELAARRPGGRSPGIASRPRARQLYPQLGRTVGLLSKGLETVGPRG